MRNILSLFLALPALAQPVSRPPAVPLVVHDPYFSIWALGDKVTNQSTRRWTGAEQPLSGILRVEWKANRFLGAWRRAVEPMRQTGLEVTATRPTYSLFPLSMSATIAGGGNRTNSTGKSAAIDISRTWRDIEQVV